MESELHIRDKVGLQDFLLLENYRDEESFIENLRIRYYKDLIYTYIGQVLISVNPCKSIDIYNDKYIKQYQNVNFYELPPHIFAIADTAYRMMREECKDQCILISGESGAGKTEASKKILQYLSAISRSNRIASIKEKLLQSNPVLEAFGNARTSRNDNSSRFGKYMDIEFDYLGQPVGGHITSYLLEKSRVVHQNDGDCNFHIFYQLLAGLDDLTLNKLDLRRDPDHYFYLNQGENQYENQMEDSKAFLNVKNAFQVFSFSAEEETAILQIIAVVLHLGQTGFLEDNGQAVIAKYQPIQSICRLLQCDEKYLKQAFTSKSIEVRGEQVCSPLTRDQAIYARDALAKAIYERLFNWLVRKLNDSLCNHSYRDRKNVIGLLDIYGFEIFGRNSFEQFCINYCNEKLQQLFIELTLKSEQEEYCREEIQWEPVEYFDNERICELIEERHRGIISILDEECVRPGEATDATFLTKLQAVLGEHPNFVTHSTADTQVKKQLTREDFRINHYAGDVTYRVTGFLDKNNDQLYRDLKKAMTYVRHSIVLQLFPADELQQKKRPLTAGTQFKQSLAQLMQLLHSKEPWYVRCIKPHENKRGGMFSNQVVRHQVKYLGLMENLRVRRAGFAYRRTFEMFLQRYKCLSARTWPNYRGEPKDGVTCLVQDLGYQSEDYRLGVSKLFIRRPRTLFETEDKFQIRKEQLVVFLQKNIRGYLKRKQFQRMREAVTQIASYYRMYRVKKELNRRRWAAGVIRAFIQGFITRNQAVTDFNRRFINGVRVRWLRRLVNHLPNSVLDRQWPAAPSVCQQTSELLQAMHRQWLVRNYCKNITAERKQLMEEKVLIEQMFKDKKDNYQASVARPFVSMRLNDVDSVISFEKHIKPADEQTVYAVQVIKYDRHGYRSRKRLLILTDLGLYLLDEKDLKVKNHISFADISEVCLSSLNDGLLVVRIPTDLKQEKGDLILDCGENIFETIVKMQKYSRNRQVNVSIEKECITHQMVDGKQGSIAFVKGYRNEISRRKDGILQVIST